MSHATARRDTRPHAADHAVTRRPVLIFVGVLIAIVLTFYGIRIATDAPFLLTGADPEPEDFESRYVAHPWLAYLHMTAGVLYLLGAPLQLSQRIRTKALHPAPLARTGARACSAGQCALRARIRTPVPVGPAPWKQWPPPSSAAGS